MKLPNPLSFFKKRSTKEYFLALLLRDERIHAVAFEQVSGRIQVIGEGKSQLPSSIEDLSDEALLDSVDKAISVAEEALPDGINTHKTVFGVKESWVEDNHITKDYLSRLKSLSEQLDLQPIGFLVFPEAIAHLLQKEEGAPISAILVDVGQKKVTMTLLRAGRIVETKEVILREDITTTVENGLKTFENIEIFPSRLILFDKGDPTLERKFLSHHWNKSLPFLHVPQVVTLPHDFDTRAILFGTATQMGLDAIDLVKEPVKAQKNSPVILGSEERTTPESLKKPEENVIPAETGIQEKSEETGSRVKPGVTNEEEIALSPSPHVVRDLRNDGAEETEEVSGNDTSEYFGFVKDSDINEDVQNPHQSPIASQDIDEVTEEIPEEEKEIEETKDSPAGFGLSGPMFFEGAKNIWKSLHAAIPKNITQSIRMPSVSQKNSLALYIAVMLILIISAFIWYIIGLHATIVLTLSPKIISQDQSITFSSSANSDPSQNIIAATPISVSEDGKASTNATGSKDIGNKATGTVTIFNSDNSSHTLTSGTTITSSNGLAFSLTNDVTVASGSSDPTNLTAGTADVSITASDIGTDYNLPSNTKFSIANTSVLAAKNANAFSGGTKQTIIVVAQKDLDNLTNQLVDSLKDKAKADLSGKVDNDTVILPEFTKTTATKTTFNQKVGDQAKTITINGIVTFETVSYKKSDIALYTKQSLQDKLPSNLVLSPSGITYSVKDLTVKDGNAKANLSMNASLIPSLDTKALARNVAGKSFSQARETLSSVPQFSDSTFTLSPNFFFLPRVLPRLSGNIRFTIVTHE